MVSLRFTLTRPEGLKMCRDIVTRRRANRASIAFGVVPIAIGVASANLIAIAIGVVYTVGIGSYIWAVVPANLWRQLPQLHSEQLVAVSDEGVTTGEARASTRTDWDHWSKLIERSGLYMITRAGSPARIVIPRRAFASAEEEDSFRQITARHLPT
ncbi:MAG TPA: YcxB family protein [Solirubrobacteraceae bacterium]|nr:YcxB family protein [Solirubrobacteraceae bacterium]